MSRRPSEARLLELREVVRHRSVLLFGPRQTGKSTLVRQAFPDAAVYDLLEADTFRDYKGLTALSEEVRLKRKIVVCGEERPRRTDDGVEIMPPGHFLEALWSGRLLG